MSGVLQAVIKIGSKTKDRKIGRIRVSLIIEICSFRKNGLGGRGSVVCEIRQIKQIWQIDAAFVFCVFIHSVWGNMLLLKCVLWMNCR
ncbi:hypothetical protein BWZ27_10405 [Neisseria meningitidis]|nr:hypothetical protein BWZ30_10265 [Neisseria meningitidis]OMH42500.1 hypothetical protein BWZ27_10405 [Neisseria meningitidis]OMH48023.1 hypothetical protein BWZ31_10420 [Neisseria meningitidis]